MVCIYCGSATRVSNSRPQKRLMQVWRRRVCVACGAAFTTNEAIDLSTSLVVRSGSTVAAFNRDKLFVSLLKALGHRKAPLEDAQALLGTVIGTLLHSTTQAALTPAEITQTALTTLKRFDKAAAVQYQAYHK